MSDRSNWNRNPEKERAWQRSSYQRNREKILTRKKARYDAAKKARYNATPAAKASRKATYHRNKKAHQLRVDARKRGFKPEMTDAEWQGVLAKYGGACLCCGSEEQVTKDHVTPVSKGGRDIVDNVQPLCRPCNSRKGTKVTDYRVLDTTL